MPRSRLARFAWVVVAFNLLVIVWGAWVRVSGSGAGCGSHWPLCDGEVVPRSLSAEKLVEYTHRATSGLALLAVAALALAARRSRPHADATRRAAAASLVLVLVEAGLGAGLVLFGLVGRDDSVARAIMMPLHLVNTFLLLGALTLTARFADGAPPPRLRKRPRATALALGILALLALAGASGAVAALGDTLYPATSLRDALAQDLDPATGTLLRLRLAHPLLAAIAAITVLVSALRSDPGRPGARARQTAAALALAQVVLGLVNVALLAPTALQLTHLLLADLLWIAAVVAASEALARQRISRPPEAKESR